MEKIPLKEKIAILKKIRKLTEKNIEEKTSTQAEAQLEQKLKEI